MSSSLYQYLCWPVGSLQISLSTPCSIGKKLFKQQDWYTVVCISLLVFTVLCMEWRLSSEKPIDILIKLYIILKQAIIKNDF